MNDEHADQDAVRALARVAGITIPDEDLPALAAKLRGHLADIQTLERLDLEAYESVVRFDPRWQ
jgi:hypothetical protein